MPERKNSELVPQEAIEEQPEPKPVEQKQERKQPDFLRFEHMTEFVDIPSRGSVYPESSPLSSGTVEIGYILAPHEDILSNRSYMQNGVMFDRLVDALLVDKTISSQEMIAGDKTALLIASRKTALGPHYNVMFKCVKCLGFYKDVIDLSKHVVLYEGEVPEGVSREGRRVTIEELPVTKVKLEFDLLTGKEDKALFDHSKRTGEEISAVQQYRMMIKKVDEYDTHEMIERFISAMPGKDSKYIKKVCSLVIPDTKLVKDSRCECGFTEPKEAVFNTEFFWPNE
jgi:hypothetical protein